MVKENLKRAAAIFAELGRLGLQSEDDLEEHLKEEPSVSHSIHDNNRYRDFS